MILIKFLAQSGLASRRECERLIKEGKIYKNNAVINDPTYVVQKDDVITYKGRSVQQKELIYFLLNKPAGYLCSKEDSKKRRLVTSLLPKALRGRLDSVGRLDFNTSGLLLFTNDGDLSYKLTHPKYKVTKTYLVSVSKDLTPEVVKRLDAGVMLSDGFIKPDDIRWHPASLRKIEITIHSGKNRIIRRLLEACGYLVKKLHRVRFAHINLKNVKLGMWRELTTSEVEKLKKL